MTQSSYLAWPELRLGPTTLNFTYVLFFCVASWWERSAQFLSCGTCIPLRPQRRQRKKRTCLNPTTVPQWQDLAWPESISRPRTHHVNNLRRLLNRDRSSLGPTNLIIQIAARRWKSDSAKADPNQSKGNPFPTFLSGFVYWRNYLHSALVFTETERKEIRFFFYCPSTLWGNLCKMWKRVGS